jgi:hypothetical protein
MPSRAWVVMRRRLHSSPEHRAVTSVRPKFALLSGPRQESATLRSSVNHSARALLVDRKQGVMSSLRTALCLTTSAIARRTDPSRNESGDCEYLRAAQRPGLGGSLAGMTESVKGGERTKDVVTVFAVADSLISVALAWLHRRPRMAWSTSEDRASWSRSVTRHGLVVDADCSQADAYFVSVVPVEPIVVA